MYLLDAGQHYFVMYIASGRYLLLSNKGNMRNKRNVTGTTDRLIRRL